MNVNPISRLTTVHLVSLLYWSTCILAFDGEDHEYDLYDSLEDELDHPSTSTSTSLDKSIHRMTGKQMENVTTHPSSKLIDENATANKSTTVLPSKLSMTPKVDSSYFTNGFTKSPTTKRSPQRQFEGPVSNPNELICMRYSRTNCDQAVSQVTKIRPASVWHCLSSKVSPTCTCTCDGSCEPVIAIKAMSNSQSSAPSDESLPCADCSCLYASVGSCLCTPGCG